MMIFKRGSKWNYRFDIAKIGGKRVLKQRGGFKTKKDAEVAGAKALHEYNNTGLTFTPSEISITDFYDLFIKDYCMANCKRTTIEGYKKRIKNYILPVIGKFRLRSITPAILQSLINDLFNRGFSFNSLSSIKGLLTGSFSYAVHPLELIQHSPAAVIKLPSKRAVPRTPTRKKVREPISEEQFNIILERFPEGHPAHVPLQLAYRVGLREGEAFALRWNRDIDLENGLLHVNEQIQWILDEDVGKSIWTFTPPKYDSTRTVFIDSELVSLLRREKERQEKNRSEYAELYVKLFVNEKNQLVTKEIGNEIFLTSVREDGTFISPRTITHALRVIHYKLGIMDMDYHTLRHTHATTLDTHGASILDIGERLGHCHLKTTKAYIHNNRTLRERTKSIIEDLYSKS